MIKIKIFHTPSKFRVGDKVLVETFFYPNTKKLTPKFQGLFTILSQPSQITFEIDYISVFDVEPNQVLHKKTDIVHISKLKEFHSSDSFQLKANRQLNHISLEHDSMSTFNPIVNFQSHSLIF